MMDKKESCLLDTLFEISGTMYVSDLKFADRVCRKQLADTIQRAYPAEKFPLNEWNEVLHYILGSEAESSSEAARDKLIQLLKR